ncbi:MAG: hypothetical protein AAF570_17375 [Bacteroidota bacterium]
MRYLRSPFLNNRPEVIPLFEILLENNAALDDETAKKHTYSLLFPDQAYKDLRLRHLMSYLTQALEGYLVQQEIRQNPANSTLHLLKAYRKRNLEKGYLSTQRKLQRHLENTPIRDETHHFNHYQLRLEAYNFSVTRSIKQNPDLDGIMQDLDLFYLISKLKQACNALTPPPPPQPRLPIGPPPHPFGTRRDSQTH